MKKTNKFLILLLLSSIYFSSNAQRKIDHMVWDQLLLLNVSNEGKVDYKGFIRDKFLFDKYFTSLSTTYPTDDFGNNEKLAYWTNLYNAIVMKMVIDNYPIQSINDIENPWKKKSITINNIAYSLDDIEHNILRKMNEPRIHFILNCAATSSPKLWNRAYTGENITQALKERTEDYINDTTKNIITNNELKISKVFEWYANDFNNGDIKTYISKYSEVKFNQEIEIKYIEYDWSLNDRAIY